MGDVHGAASVMVQTLATVYTCCERKALSLLGLVFVCALLVSVVVSFGLRGACSVILQYFGVNRAEQNQAAW